MRRVAILLLAFGCAPDVQWAPAPVGTMSALVAIGEEPIVAMTVTDELTVTFDAASAGEVAYYDRPLVELGLASGVVPFVDGGAPLSSPTAAFTRAANDAWAKSEELGPRLTAMRVGVDLPDGCFRFEQIETTFPPLGLRFMVRTDDDRVIVGDGAGDVYLIDETLSAPAVIPIRSTGAPPRIFIYGRRIGGAYPFVFGTRSGQLWRGRFDPGGPALEVDWVTTLPSGLPATRLDGTLDPMDLHVIENGGLEEELPVTWRRFDGTEWSTIGSLPQQALSALFDVYYRAPGEVYATVLAPGSQVLRFDGTTTHREDAPPLAVVAELPGIGVVGGSFESIHVREGSRWELRHAMDNIAFPDEAVQAVTDYPGGLIMVGKSFLVQTVGAKTCPTRYVWPGLRFTFVERFGDALVIGTYTRPERSPLTYLRPIR